MRARRYELKPRAGRRTVRGLGAAPTQKRLGKTLNIHGHVLYHFVGNSIVSKINVTYNDRYSLIHYCEETKFTHNWSKMEIFLGFQMGFPKFL